MAIVAEPTKLCRRCHKRLPATTDYFARHRIAHGVTQLEATCRMCKADIRHRENPWRVKAWRTIELHTHAYMDEYTRTPQAFPSWDGSYATFAKAYGWAPGLIAGEMQAAYEGPCRSCGGYFKEMGHGRGDLTVDIIDPSQEPFYQYNTRLVCRSCNGRKGARMPHKEARLRQAYERWQATEHENHQPSLWALEPVDVAPAVPVPAASTAPAVVYSGSQLTFFHLVDGGHAELCAEWSPPLDSVGVEIESLEGEGE